MSKQVVRQVVILGGGASGMMAAITAANEGADVTIIESSERLGKKILATGNGKCNFTNRFQSIECYRSGEPEKVKTVLEQFSVEDTLTFFSDLGIYPVEKNGYYYPGSGQASSVLDVLRLEVERLQVKVLTNMTVSMIKNDNVSAYILTVQDRESGCREKIFADAIIFATGSKAGNGAGTEKNGIQLIRKLGIKVIQPLPALVQLKCREAFYKALSGVRVSGKVTLLVDEKPVGEDTGEIQLTAYGISGIPVFQISRFAARALEEGKYVRAVMDFAPEMEKEALYEYLQARRKKHPERKAEEFLLGFFNKKLALVLLKNSAIGLTENCKDITDSDIKKLTEQIKNFSTVVVEPNGLEQAQVCCGGVDLSEVNEQLEAVKHPGIYFAGECLDVDGICGGYNLQWAWSSGYTAGKNAGKKER